MPIYTEGLPPNYADFVSLHDIQRQWKTKPLLDVGMVGRFEAYVTLLGFELVSATPPHDVLGGANLTMSDLNDAGLTLQDFGKASVAFANDADPPEIARKMTSTKVDTSSLPTFEEAEAELRASGWVNLTETAPLVGVKSWTQVLSWTDRAQALPTLVVPDGDSRGREKSKPLRWGFFPSEVERIKAVVSQFFADAQAEDDAANEEADRLYNEGRQRVAAERAAREASGGREYVRLMAEARVPYDDARQAYRARLDAAVAKLAGIRAECKAIRDERYAEISVEAKAKTAAGESYRLVWRWTRIAKAEARQADFAVSVPAQTACAEESMAARAEWRRVKGALRREMFARQAEIRTQFAE